MNHLIVDLEATCCDQNSILRSQTEIIEIGAVIVAEPSFDLEGTHHRGIDDARNIAKIFRYLAIR